MVNENRNSLYAKINIAKKQQGLDEETYRAFLLSSTGKESLKLMSYKDLQKVIKGFEDTGFVATKKTDKPSVEAHLQGQINKIGAILTELGRVRKVYIPWSYATGILKQMYNISTWNTSNREQLQSIITALICQLDKERA